MFKKIEKYLAGEKALQQSVPTIPFEKGTLAWYKHAWSIMKFDLGYEIPVLNDVKIILKGKSSYVAVEKATGVPWWIVGCIHMREASCNFKGLLHNGERGIIGPEAIKANRKSTIVPKGVGPFPTWEAAAIHAITMNGNRWEKIKAGGHKIEEILYAVERYNGLGYVTGAGKADNSPYLWARTNINDDFGQYVRDGKYDPNSSVQNTSGFAALAKKLEMLGEIRIS